MATDKKQLANLMNLTSGDKKHDPSAYSTLEVLWVLYDRILTYDASNPQSEDRDRFIMSKGHVFYLDIILIMSKYLSSLLVP